MKPMNDQTIENPADNPPAFARVGNEYIPPQEGMSLRDYFAAKAMQGAIANGALERIAKSVTAEHSTISGVVAATNHLLASQCYEIADAMLKARLAQ